MIVFSSNTPKGSQKQGMAAHLKYSFLGLTIGAGFILIGAVLMALGKAAVGWISFSFFGIHLDASDAIAPGAVMIVAGLVIVFVTRLKVKYVEQREH